MFSSERKSQRASLRTAKNTSSKHLSTAIGASLRFKEAGREEREVKEFQEESGKKEVGNAGPYEGWNLVKDINYLNSIYSHILILTSSHIRTPNTNPSSYQLAKLSTQIESIIHQNLQLKEQIGLKYRSMTNLQEIAEHLGAGPKEVQKGPLQEFLASYEEKEGKAQQLSLELGGLQKHQSKNGASTQKIKEKEARCKALRRAVQKQKQRIAKMEQQERSLMKKLYSTQRQLLKNQHSSSLIKLKLTEAQDHQQKRARAKTRDGHSGKQNLPLANREKRSMKIEQFQKLRPMNGHI